MTSFAPIQARAEPLALSGPDASGVPTRMARAEPPHLQPRRGWSCHGGLRRRRRRGSGGCLIRVGCHGFRRLRRRTLAGGCYLDSGLASAAALLEQERLALAQHNQRPLRSQVHLDAVYGAGLIQLPPRPGTLTVQ